MARGKPLSEKSKTVRAYCIKYPDMDAKELAAKINQEVKGLNIESINVYQARKALAEKPTPEIITVREVSVEGKEGETRLTSEAEKLQLPVAQVIETRKSITQPRPQDTELLTQLKELVNLIGKEGCKKLIDSL